MGEQWKIQKPHLWHVEKLRPITDTNQRPCPFIFWESSRSCGWTEKRLHCSTQSQDEMYLEMSLVSTWAQSKLSLSMWHAVALRWHWDTFEIAMRWCWESFEMTLRWYWESFEMALRWLWDGIEKALRWLWDGFEMVLRKLWDGFEMALGSYEPLKPHCRHDSTMHLCCYWLC